MARGTLIFNPKRFTYYHLIGPLSVTHFNHFQTSEVRFGMRFDVPPNITRLSHFDFVLEAIFGQLLNDVFKQFVVLPYHKIRIVFQHPHMLASAISIPVVSVYKITPRSLLNFIQSLLRSGESSWIFDGAMIVNLMIFRAPRGRGHGSKMKNPVTFRAEDRYKALKGIVTINPSPHDPKNALCGPRSVVVSISKFRDDKKVYDIIRKSDKKRQTEEALLLCEAAGVRPGPCGLPEIELFQQYLATQNIQLLAINANANNQPMNDSPQYKNLACILYDNGHFHAVTKPHLMVGKDFRCGICLKFAHNKGSHSCYRPCSACFQPDCKDRFDTGAVKRRCDLCNRSFYGSHCYDLHLTRKCKQRSENICSAYQKCAECSQYINAPDSRVRSVPHDCDKIYCQLCKSMVESNHLCFMKTGSDSLAKVKCVPTTARDATRYLHKTFSYDFECMWDAESGEHTPNCVDYICLEDGTVTDTIYGDNCHIKFVNWIFTNCRNCVFLAHNASRYDSLYITKALESENHFPSKIQNGSTIILIEIKGIGVRFLDSFSFLPRSLKCLGEDFKLPLDMRKGYFPHLFNTRENQSYVGPLPDKSMYGYKEMSQKEKTKFDEWYEEEQTRVADQWSLRDQIISYNRQDTRVLAECLKINRANFKEKTGGLDCYEYPTMASASISAIQFKFLPHNAIGLVPLGGYGGRGLQSNKALEYLAYQQATGDVQIQTVRSAAGEKLLYGKIPLDGWIEEDGMAINFHGCYFHGCRHHFPMDNELNTLRMLTWKEIREDNDRKDRKIRCHPAVKHYIVKWECEWDADKRRKPEIDDILVKKKYRPRGEPRTALFGGRVEVFCLQKEVDNADDTIEHDDYQSLYPSVNLEGKYGKGHPRVFYANFPPVEEWFGVVYCTILPSRTCYVPVLPFRMPSKSVVYTLCCTCALTRNLDEECHHDDEERSLTGFWDCEEVQVAVLEAGYKILQIHELHHFEETIQFNRETGGHGLFDECVRTFAKEKIVSSGFPESVVTVEQKKLYCNGWKSFLDIHITPEEVEDNPGRRFCAKTSINLIWGRFVMRDDYDQVEYCQEYSRYLKLMVGAQYQPKSVRFVRNTVAEVVYKEAKEITRPNQRTNIYIGIRTTAMARLRLLRECLWQFPIGELLYCDTDSAVYYRHSNQATLPRGPYLGQLSSENKGKRCVRFAALGRKTYTKVMEDGETHLKAKGITMNPSNQALLTYSTMKGMLDGTDWFSVKTHNPSAFRRDVQQMTVRTLPMSRTVRCTVKGRVIGKGYITYPFGYNAIRFPDEGTPEYNLVKAIKADDPEAENLQRAEQFGFREEEEDEFQEKDSEHTVFFDEETAE